MSRRRSRSSFVVRVVSQADWRRITVQNLRTKEMQEFSSWAALMRYLQSSSRTGGLR